MYPLHELANVFIEVHDGPFMNGYELAVILLHKRLTILLKPLPIALVLLEQGQNFAQIGHHKK